MPASRPDIQNRVTLQPKTNATFQAQNFGADQIGRGISQFGQGMSDVADDLQVVQDIHDEAAVKEVEVQAIDAANAFTRDVLGSKGQNAVKAAEESDGRLQSIFEEANSRLTTSRQKEMFKTVFDQRAVGYKDKIGGHVTSETLSWAVTASAKRSAQLVDDFTMEEDPDVQDKLLETMGREKKIELSLLGADEGTIQSELKDIRSVAYVSRAENIALKDPQAAREYVAGLGDKVTGDHFNKFMGGIRVRADKAVAAGVFDEILLGAQSAPPGEVPEVDPAKRDAALTTYADPTRGKGNTSSDAQRFNAKRDGGKRVHGALDMGGMAEGTAVYPGYDGGGTVTEIDDKAITEAGYYVMVRHDDGTVTSYSHLRNISVKPGDKVNANTVLGGVGGTGVGGEKTFDTHLHYKIRDPGGNNVDPEKYAASGSYNPKYDGTKVDVEGMYERARVLGAERRMTREQVGDVFDEIDAYARRQDVVQSRAYAEAEIEVVKQETEMLKDGIVLTDPDKQLQGIENMSPEGELALRRRAASNRQVQNNAAKTLQVKADTNSYWTLVGAAQDNNTNPETGRPWNMDFAATDIRLEYGAVLTERQIVFLEAKQKDIRTGVKPVASRVRTAVNRYLPEAGIDDTKAAVDGSDDRMKKAYLIEKATERLEAEQKQLGRALTDLEIQEKIVKPMIAKHYKWEDGTFSWGYDNDNPVPAYQVQGGFVEGETIPVAQYNQIVRDLKKADPNHGVTDEDVKEVYQARRKR
jgi:murein DD-endopeptidase MepM/ murein hydrolase activator NlpD